MVEEVYHTVIQTPMVVMVVEPMVAIQTVEVEEEHKTQVVLKDQHLVETLVAMVQELDYKVDLQVVDLDAQTLVLVAVAAGGAVVQVVIVIVVTPMVAVAVDQDILIHH